MQKKFVNFLDDLVREKALQKLYISRPLLIRNGSMIKFNPRGYSVAEADQGLELFK